MRWKPTPLADRQLTGGPQRGGHLLGDLEVPPAAAAPSLHVHRAQRPLVADAAAQVGRPPPGARRPDRPTRGDAGTRLAAELERPGRARSASSSPRGPSTRRAARRAAAAPRPSVGSKPSRRESEHDGVAARAGDGHGVELQVAEAPDHPVRRRRAPAGPSPGRGGADRSSSGLSRPARASARRRADRRSTVSTACRLTPGSAARAGRAPRSAGGRPDPEVRWPRHEPRPDQWR